MESAAWTQAVPAGARIAIGVGAGLRMELQDLASLRTSRDQGQRSVAVHHRARGVVDFIERTHAAVYAGGEVILEGLAPAEDGGVDVVVRQGE